MLHHKLSSAGKKRVREELARLRRAKARVDLTPGRFGAQCFLKVVYRVHRVWSSRDDLRQSRKYAAELLRMNHEPAVNDFRFLIEAGWPKLNSKTASRWARALKYAAASAVLPDQLDRLFWERGGIAGCARYAAAHDQKMRIRPNSIPEQHERNSKALNQADAFSIPNQTAQHQGRAVGVTSLRGLPLSKSKAVPNGWQRGSFQLSKRSADDARRS